MKTAAIALCCLACALLLPSSLPAPGYPCIDVTKQCTDPLNSDGLILFSGTVRNCGAYALSEVTVVDDNGTPGVPADDVAVFSAATLDPGVTASFSGSYLPASSPSTDTVTATGSYPAFGFTATDTASATCKWLTEGCSLTYGYWKTHSKYGPAPYDNAWALLLPAGEDSPFFLSGKTYIEVLGTEPRGNPYFSLAHQFIAAQLNILNGAAMPAEVLGAWNAAGALFESYAPGQVTQKGAGALRAQFSALALVLDDYNMGVTGPGHCNGIERD